MQFTVIAAIVFAVQAVVFSDEREIILVEESTREALLNQHSELLARDLSETEIEQVIAEYIEKEILVREARKQGMDNTSRIKDLMARNMRVLIRSDEQEPNEKQLQQYFANNTERFSTPIRLEVEVINPEGSVPINMLEQLNATVVGENSTQLKPRPLLLSERRLTNAFGKNVATQILEIADDKWHGPFNSREGIFFLRIKKHIESRTPDFTEVIDRVKQDWLAEKQREHTAREIDKLRQNYRIIIGSNADE